MSDWTGPDIAIYSTLLYAFVFLVVGMIHVCSTQDRDCWRTSNATLGIMILMCCPFIACCQFYNLVHSCIDYCALRSFNKSVQVAPIDALQVVVVVEVQQPDDAIYLGKYMVKS